MSFDRLIAKIQETKNPTVVGLDPAYSYVPKFLKEKYAGQLPTHWKVGLCRYWNTTKP